MIPALLLALLVQAAPPQEPKPAGEPMQDAVPVRDRWGIPFPEYFLNQPGRFPDPYRQNVLKGDYPIVGQNVFMVLTARSDTAVEARTLPVPSGASTAGGSRPDFFGGGEQWAVTQDLAVTLELYHGETSFRPRTWELRATAAGNVNHVDVLENAVVKPDVRDGTDRTDHHLALQEALVEVHLADLSDTYDFVSLRAGIQPFVSDFRGLLFSDTNLGARLFGTFASNRIQWNLAAFDPLEKDTNSGLNTDRRRDQLVWVGNVYVQDFLWPGYTAQLSVHGSHDNGEIHYDDNKFLVRPAFMGTIRAHDVDAVYAGWAGDGHIGALNLTHAIYAAFGRDEFNPLAGRETDIQAYLAALELSYDADWVRGRVSFLWASGDRDPTDDTATGFDSIFESPNFAGGAFSFWNRQAIKLQGVDLVNRNSQLPALRSSKSQGQLNFVNPGLFLANLGLDAEVLPEVKAVFNANLLWFQDTRSLELFTFQPRIDREVGFEISLGLVTRPLLNNNVLLTAGASGFFPGEGFKDLYESSDPLYSVFAQLTLIY